MTGKHTERQHRTTQITIRLEPKIYDALHDVANRVGMKAANIAGLAIGEYVTKAQSNFDSTRQIHKTVAKEFTTLLFEHIKPNLEQTLSIEQIEEIFRNSIDD